MVYCCMLSLGMLFARVHTMWRTTSRKVVKMVGYNEDERKEQADGVTLKVFQIPDLQHYTGAGRFWYHSEKGMMINLSF